MLILWTRLGNWQLSSISALISRNCRFLMSLALFVFGDRRKANENENGNETDSGNDNWRMHNRRKNAWFRISCRLNEHQLTSLSFTWKMSITFKILKRLPAHWIDFFSFWNSICATNKYGREICLETYRITVNWAPPVRIQNSYRCASSKNDTYQCIHWSRTLAYITQSKYVLKSTDCMYRHEVKRDMHAHVHKYNAHKHIISELETPEAFVCRLFILA